MTATGHRAALLEVDDVVRTFRLPRRSLYAPPAEVRALRGVSIRVYPGETVGIVGESGSGKTTLARLLLALDSPQSGRIRYEDLDLVGTRERDLRRLRREVQIVFQDPMSSLDPHMRVRDIVLEPLRALAVDEDHDARLGELLEAVGLPEGAARRFPHEFSGGQRQRIAIARALAPRPRVLVADEPVSALDLSVRAQILNLLQDLKRRYTLTLVLISHDLSVVEHMCDRVAVMYLGRIVEIGLTHELFSNPQHPYTRLLLDSIPTIEGGLPHAIAGEVPSSARIPVGCSFAPRCPLVHDRCLAEDPRLLDERGDPPDEAERRAAACHLAFTDRIGTVSSMSRRAEDSRP